MTNSNISKIVNNYQTQGLSRGNVDSTKQTKDIQAVFASMMNQMNLDVNQSAKMPEQNSLSVKETPAADYAESVADRKKPEEYSGSDATRIKKAEDASVTLKKKTDELSEETGEAIRNVMKEKLGVTDEELDAVLEEMNLTLMDLLIPVNLVQVVSELTGVEDASNLLMNENFMDVMQALNGITADLAAELSISSEELQRMLAEATEQTEQTEQTGGQIELNVQQTENAPVETDTDARMEILSGADDEMVQAIDEDAAVADVDVDTEEQADAIKHTPEPQNSQENSSDAESDLGEMLKDRSSAANQDTKSAEPGMFEANVSRTMMQGQAAEVNSATVTPVYTGEVNVSEVLQQIAEFVKVSVNQDTTSLEMQLNPENLGKLYLQLTSSKEGSITAQFAAQNEAVKEALETQIVELRQTLNQQGIKVDAIEVTVATHEFEKNLEQNAQGEKQQGQEEEKKQGRRNLNLNQLDELSGLMSEEETLAVKIMRENGNSMDISV